MFKVQNSTKTRICTMGWTAHFLNQSAFSGFVQLLNAKKHQITVTPSFNHYLSEN